MATVNISAMAKTWNDAGTTFTGIGLDVTDTASNAASLLMKLQVGGSNKFAVDKTGQVQVATYTNFANLSAGGGIEFATGVSLGSAGAGQFAIGDSGGATRHFVSTGASGFMNLDTGHHLGWGSTAGQAYNGGNLRLYRDAAAILAQRNGTNAQTHRVYGTYTTVSDYERLAITRDAITVESAGTGTANIDLALTPAGTGVLKFGSHTALGGESLSGYITIKDAGGTSRKVAVVS